jgi:RNA polymerase sigma factor (sigma-70 family)
MDDEAKFVVQNDKLIQFQINLLCRQYRGYQQIDFRDMLQVGRMALLLAFRQYEPGRKAKLSTFAGNMVRWALQREFGEDFQRDPAFHAYPIDDVIDERDAIEEIEERDQHAAMMTFIDTALNKMDARTATTVRLFHGVLGERPHTLAEIAWNLGVSRARVGQIIQKGESRLEREVVREMQRMEISTFKRYKAWFLAREVEEVNGDKSSTGLE